MSTAPAPVVAAPHVSWLKKVGQFFGKVIKAIATDAAPIEKIAVPVAETLLPAFAPLIQTADGIFSRIVSEAVTAETVISGVGTGTGAQKLEQVLTSIGPVIDGWVSANFPGAKQVSTVQKSGLINAVVAILNEIDPSAMASPVAVSATTPATS